MFFHLSIMSEDVYFRIDVTALHWLACPAFSHALQ
jgi:hypothetical protein